MKIKTITTTSNKELTEDLVRSLEYFGYDYSVIYHDWYGFLAKLHETYKYLKSLEGYTHFIYTDAWDSLAVNTTRFVTDNLTFSTERACYPHPEKATRYPDHYSPWKYVNGGGYCGSINAFISMYEFHPPTDELNDQVYLTDRFLDFKGIELDYECKLFQTTGFCPSSDFERIGLNNPVLINTIHQTRPAFWHGNGHTPIDWIKALYNDFR